MTTIVTINRKIIARNRKEGRNDPPFRVSNGRYGKPTYHQTYIAGDKVTLVYDKEHPLPCGATVWMEIE